MKVISNDLGDYFIDDIAQSDRSEFPWILCAISFRDERKESGIKSSQNVSIPP